MIHQRLIDSRWFTPGSYTLALKKVPGHGLIGHELAILNFLAWKVPVLGGQDDAECAVSFQIVQAAEDIYLKLTKYQNTMGIKDKCA